MRFNAATRPMAVLAVSAALFVPSLMAQETDGAPAPGATVAQSLRQFLSGTHTWSGEVRVTEPAAPSGMMMMGPGMQSEGKQFTGPISVLFRDGTSLAASDAALPGVVLACRGEKAILRTTTTAADPLDTSALREELASVLDTQNVLKWIERVSDWKSKSTDGRTTHTARLSESTMRSRKEGASEFDFPDLSRPKVLRVHGSFTFDDKQNLVKWEIAVTHSDPMATLMRLAEEEGGMIDPESLQDAEPEVGGVTTYEFSKTPDAASDRLGALWAELVPLLK